MIRKAAEMVLETRDSMRGGMGRVHIQHYFKQDEFTSKTRLCARLSIPPGSSIGAHQHTGEDEVYVVLKGVGLLDDGKTQMRVSEGDAILTGNGQSHAISNVGSEDLEIMAVIHTY